MLLRRSSRCSTHASLPNYYGKIIILHKDSTDLRKNKIVISPALQPSSKPSKPIERCRSSDSLPTEAPSHLLLLKTVATECLSLFMKLTAAGLSGILTRFPFNPLYTKRLERGTTLGGKDTIFIVIQQSATTK